MKPSLASVTGLVYLTGRLIIALVLLIIAATTVAYGVYECAPLNSSSLFVYPVNSGYEAVDGQTYYFTQNQSSPNLPSYSYEAVFVFRARGAVSVNNPVHVHVELYDAENGNLTSTLDVLNYYDAISFSDAYEPNLPDIADQSNILSAAATFPLQFGPYNVTFNSWTCSIFGYGCGPCPSNACPSRLPCGVNECADGDVIWVSDGPSWDYLQPNWTTYPDVHVPSAPQIEADPNSHDYSQIEALVTPLHCPGDTENCRPSSVTVTGLSDTLGVQNNLTIQRLTFILLGFSIILLLDIIEKVVSEPVREVRHQTPPPPPPS